MNHQDLIKFALQGDLDSFNQLVLEFQTMVYRHAYYMLHDHDKAEDIAQDTFIAAYKNLPQYRGGSFKAWLMRIATNFCLDELRRQKRRRFLPITFFTRQNEQEETEERLPESGPSVEEIVEQSELYQALRTQLEQLDPIYRSAIALVDMQGFDYDEAAETLGVPLGTLKSRLVRARHQLCVRLKSTPEMRLMAGYA
jgi:RNA polymerase sigma factor (sigma-70 family)